MLLFFYALLGLAAGILSGLIGIGGGILIVPVLTLFFHFSQHKAQGTSLAALLLPIGIFAFWEYYKAGNVDLKAAALIVVGFAIGGYFGGVWAQQIPEAAMRKVFASVLFLVSIRLFFK